MRKVDTYKQKQRTWK